MSRAEKGLERGLAICSHMSAKNKFFIQQAKVVSNIVSKYVLQLLTTNTALIKFEGFMQ